MVRRDAVVHHQHADAHSSRQMRHHLKVEGGHSHDEAATTEIEQHPVVRAVVGDEPLTWHAVRRHTSCVAMDGS